MGFKGVGIGLFCCFEDRVGEPFVGWGCRLVWSRLVASGAIDPGSNPGSPIFSPELAAFAWDALEGLGFGSEGIRRV